MLGTFSGNGEATSTLVASGERERWPDEGRLLKMRDIVRLVNCSAGTIRRATDSGLLPCYRLSSGGARRFKLSDVKRFLGESTDSVIDDGELKQGKAQFGIEVACCLRVSSQKQGSARGESDKSSLQHQEERVTAFIKERWGNRANVTFYRSIGSGMDFNRPVLQKLVVDLIEGKYRHGYLVAQDYSRICRFGVKLIELLAKIGGCTIVYTMGEDEAEEKGYAELLTDEILCILTHYTARASAEKSRKVLTVRVSPDVVQEIWRLHQAGYSYRYIAQELARTGRGRGECNREITKRVCERVVKEHGAGLKLLAANSPEPVFPALANSFVEWFSTHVRLTGQPECKCKQTAMIQKYREWCQTQGRAPMTANSIRKAMKTHFPGVQSRFTDSGTVQYLGMTFTTG